VAEKSVLIPVPGSVPSRNPYRVCAGQDKKDANLSRDKAGTSRDRTRSTGRTRQEGPPFCVLLHSPGSVRSFFKGLRRPRQASRGYVMLHFVQEISGATAPKSPLGPWNARAPCYSDCRSLK
jgi:hypothetical protein